MQNQLSQVWPQVEALLSAGISIIPVRDKDEQMPDGKTRPAKTPYNKWQQFQSRIATKEELWHEMERHDTTAISMICGAISGNLEVIDVDIKHWQGVDSRLFKDIRDLYPELWERLRIHSTPSGGYHILYRIDGATAAGNQKLAYKADNKECGIETRGEGGYVLAPPSMGYGVHRPGSTGGIPVITPAERDSLIGLCTTYNEKIKVTSTYSPTKYDNSYYDENPFEHFNNSPEAEEVLTASGWELYRQSGDFVQYTRTGKTSGVSATFCRKRRLFYFFTTSTDLEGKKWYNPATVLSVLQHAGDRKRTYRWLVENGYGKIKAGREASIVHQAATFRKDPPKNLSPEAREAYEKEAAAVYEKYPAGIFWLLNDKEQMSISREALYRVAEFLGYRVFGTEIPVYIDPVHSYKVHRISPRQLWDGIKSYIQEEDLEEQDSICNAYEAFVQKSGQFTITRLPSLDTDRLMRSTKQVSYKYYSNGYLSITSDAIEQVPYSAITGLIWADQIQPRPYTPAGKEDIAKSMYYRFLKLATGLSDTTKAAIGYLAHEHKDEEGGYIITLTEQCPDPKLGGGSGKNVFSSLFAYTTTYKNIPGSQIQYNEKFLQAWDFQRILSISDVPKKFDFGFLKELSTGTGVIKKLWQNEVTLGSADMPKLIVSTNFSYEISDGGLRRRIIPIEFTDFFTRAGGVNAHFKAMFPTGWNDDEWSAYDTVIANCIQIFLSLDSELSADRLTSGGWVKQFEQSYGALTFQFIEEAMSGWLFTEKVTPEDFNNQYDRFCHDNGIQSKFKCSSILMNRALEDYCNEKNIYFEKKHQYRANAYDTKKDTCRLFKLQN